MFFNVIVVVILLIIISKQNSRLSKIEKSLINFSGKPSENSVSRKMSPEGKLFPDTDNVSVNASESVDSVKPAYMPNEQTSPVIEKTSIQNKVVAPEVNAEEASGRLLGKIGIAAVVIGISFFLKYAFENNWVGPTGRVMIGIIAGLALLGVGQYLRKKYLQYSDLIMGGGIAVLYLSVYAANTFYHLVSPTVAGFFMFCVTAFALAISVFNATQVLAMVSLVGGIATPFLISVTPSGMPALYGYLAILNIGVLTIASFKNWQPLAMASIVGCLLTPAFLNVGSNDMMMLFGYLVITNIVILAISSFKDWPNLAVLAFVGTLINFGHWFDLFYKPDVFGPTLFFCFLTFIIFLFAGVSRAIVNKSATDQSSFFLLGGNALFFAIIGYILLKPEYNGLLGFAAVFIALVYMVVAVMVNKFNPENKALNIFLPGLAVTFLSVAVPLQFSGPWIAVAWFVESVSLYAIASTISNRGFQVMGVIVYVLGLINFFGWNFPKANSQDFIAIFNSHFMVLMLATICAYVIAYTYRKYGSVTVEVQKQGIVAFVLLANIITIFAFSSQIIFYHNSKIAVIQKSYNEDYQKNSLYSGGYDTSGMQQEASQKYFSERISIQNRSNTYVSIFWALYAAILTAIGFGKRMMAPRRLGLGIFIITALKVMFDVWSLGQLYRIVSFIVFGVIALGTSFAYTKYKDRLKEII